MMTQATVNLSFTEYLDWSSDPANYREERFLLIDGELVEMPPESGVNRSIANMLTMQKLEQELKWFSA